MEPHSRPVKARSPVRPAPSDPAVIASQVLANARPYDTLVESAILSQKASAPGQPFTSCYGSIGPVHPTWFVPVPLGRPIRSVRPRTPSPGKHRDTSPPARPEYDSLPQPGALNPGDLVQPQFGHPLHHHLSPDSAISPLSNSFRSPASRPRDSPSKEVSPSFEVPASPGGSSISFNDRQYSFVAYGDPDPAVRSKQRRTIADNDRIDAIQAKGGACFPCRQSRQRCDDLGHCQRCVKKGIQSEADFLTSTPPVSDLEKISLYPLQPPAPRDTRSPTVVNASSITDAREKATHHVNSWFKEVTRMIDPKPFYNHIFGVVSLRIASGIHRQRETAFNLEILDISSHLEIIAYQLNEENLLAGFLGHSSAQMPPAPEHGQLPSQSVMHLSWVVSRTCAFLRSFANADMYAAINSMSAARATVSIVYASLYRLLLAKSDELCSFVLKYSQRYCARKSVEAVSEDLLRALAQYHCVVTELASLELGSSTEAAALLSGLSGRAQSLLRNDGIRQLFLSTYKKRRPRSSQSAAESRFEKLIHSYSLEVAEIKPLSIALRINSGSDDLAPTSTEAIRDADPWNHYHPIKVRDLLKEGEDFVVDPEQVYVDNHVENFDDLGTTLDFEPAGPNSRPRSSASQDLFSLYDSGMDETQSTSLHPEHASISASQQDTETGSIESELTVQMDPWLGHAQLMGLSLVEEPIEAEWRSVPFKKGHKRRERSGDSQTSNRASGCAARKHIKLHSGRESPQPHNYFGPLTEEPALLR